jgi:group I intron endonuclease
MGAVYVIFNIVSGHKYIGSTVEPERRWYNHKQALYRGDHRNAHLQHAWDEYGEEAFVFATLVDGVADEDLSCTEQYYLDIIPQETLYNFQEDAWRPPDLTGRKLTKEHRRKISEANKGRIVSIDTRSKISKKRSRPYPAFINLHTGEVIPEGVGMARECRRRGLSIGKMSGVRNGQAISHKGWALLDESKRKSHGNANAYPALINDATGEIIPAGYNIRSLCRRYGFQSRFTLTAMINGQYEQYLGWRIYCEDDMEVYGE